MSQVGHAQDLTCSVRAVTAFNVHTDQECWASKIYLVTSNVGSIQDRLTTDGLIDKSIRGHMISINLPTRESRNCHVCIREYTNVFSEKDETFQHRPEACPIHTLADDFLEYVRLKSVEYDVQHVFAGGEPLHFH